MSKINILGASCIDILTAYADKELFFSGKYKCEQIRTAFGGDGLNEAIVLAALMEDVSLSTLLGDDPSGHMIHDFLKQNKVNTDNVIFEKDIDTYISLVFIEKDGQRNFVGSQNGSLRLYDLKHVKIDDDCKIVSFASLFISKMFDDAKLVSLFSSIKEKGITLCVDCSTPKNNEYALDLKCLSYIDYFFCNESEAKALCRKDELFECEQILKEAGVKHPVIKAGEKGCLYNGSYYAPKQKVHCIDTTGAGDSFVAGFIHGLSSQMDIDGCIEMANKCGSRAVEYIGANEWVFHL